MRTHRLALAAALALAASLSSPARAEEPPAGGPKPMAKVENAFLDGLVGSWDAVVKAHGSDLKGTDRWSKAVGGTAWIHELRFGEGAATFHGLGVVRLGPDGKAATMWWYDSMGKGGVWTFKGTVSADGFEFASDEGGMSATKGLKKSEGGLSYRMTVGGKEMVAGTWKKAEKPAVAAEPTDTALAKHAFAKAHLGEWDVAGTSSGQKYTGKARFRLGVGGHCLLQEYDVEGSGMRSSGFGVSALADDGKSMRTWWFGNFFVDPFAMSGPLTEKTWSGKTAPGVMGDTAVETRVTETGIETSVTVGGSPVLTDTYTRAKAK